MNSRKHLRKKHRKKTRSKRGGILGREACTRKEGMAGSDGTCFSIVGKKKTCWGQGVGGQVVGCARELVDSGYGGALGTIHGECRSLTSLFTQDTINAAKKASKTGLAIKNPDGTEKQTHDYKRILCAWWTGPDVFVSPDDPVIVALNNTVGEGRRPAWLDPYKVTNYRGRRGSNGGGSRKKRRNKTKKNKKKERKRH